MRSPSFIPYQQGARSVPTAKGAADFLRASDKMAAILPAITRMAALQADCAAVLPAMFNVCSVLSYESDQLVLAIPNAAIASKLKQQLPKLQDNLCKRGWQVSAIRLKVQVTSEFVAPQKLKQLQLSNKATSALANLDDALEDSPHNKSLKAALKTMLQRHR